MTWTPIKLRRRGEIAFIGEAEGAGGGSQPGVAEWTPYYNFDFADVNAGVASIVALTEGATLLDASFWIDTAFDDTSGDLTTYIYVGTLPAADGLQLGAFGVDLKNGNANVPPGNTDSYGSVKGMLYQPVIARYADTQFLGQPIIAGAGVEAYLSWPLANGDGMAGAARVRLLIAPPVAP